MMLEEEVEDNAPYDNVEFPVRKPGTGTWPGPAGTGSKAGGGGIGGGGGAAGVKLYGHQTTPRGTLAGVPKLAPLVEVEGGSDSNERIPLTSSPNLITNGGGATVNGGSSSATSSTSSLQSSSAAKQAARNQFLASKPPSPGSIRRSQATTPGMAGVTSMSSASSNMSASSSSALSGSSNSPKLPSPSTSTTPLVAATTATTATAATTATIAASSSTSSSGGSATAATTNSTKQPVVKFTNDNSLYMPTEVTGSDGSKKKTTLRLAESEEEDFKRQDLNPASRRALESVYTQHKDFYQLNSKVLDEGSLLKQDVLDIYRKTGETLTYEQLLQGMLVDGERFLLGSCWLYFTHVQFLDLEGTKTVREPYGRGRIGLTSKRVLFLSTETYTDANLEQFSNGGTKKKPNSGYKLEVSKRSSVTFKNIPLSNFHSAEMEVITGTAAQTKITKKEGCFSCLGIQWGSQWVSTTPMTRSIASRVVRVGVSMPPWQTRMFMDIHLDPAMSLTVARDFISQLHAFAPHMH